MVSANAVGRRELKGGIAMMVRFVDLMDQRRAVVGPGRLSAMTHRAMSVELRFPNLKLGWNRSLTHRLLGR